MSRKEGQRVYEMDASDSTNSKEYYRDKSVSISSNDRSVARAVLLVLLVGSAVVAGVGNAAVDTTTALTATNDSAAATVTGQAVYIDPHGNEQPMRQVRVEVYDADGHGDELIATTRADDSGEFSVSFDPSEWDDDSGADVYVRIPAANPAAKATTDEKAVYETTTSVTANVTDGQQVDYGTHHPTANNMGWEAIDYALTARRYIEDNTDGWTRRQIRIEVPAGDWPSTEYRTYSNGTIKPETEAITLPDRDEVYWTRYSVLHEYGHVTMYAMYDYDHGEIPPYNAYGCHRLYSETDPNYALIEGWAQFVAASINEDPSLHTARGMDTETNQWYDVQDDGGRCVGGDAGEMDGHKVEGSVLSIWWDVTDTGWANDESMDASFNDVFQTLENNNVQNMTEFFQEWDWGDRDVLRQIYGTYGIDVDRNEPPTETPTEPPTETPTTTPTETPTTTPPKTPTETPTYPPTETPKKTPRETPTTTPPATPTPTPTETPTTTPTETPTSTPTVTPAPTETPTTTPPGTPTPTPTPTETPPKTSTPTPSPPKTPTSTPPRKPTEKPTTTPTETPPKTPPETTTSTLPETPPRATGTPPETPTSTPTETPTETPTPTVTPTSTLPETPPGTTGTPPETPTPTDTPMPTTGNSGTPEFGTMSPTDASSAAGDDASNTTSEETTSDQSTTVARAASGDGTGELPLDNVLDGSLLTVGFLLRAILLTLLFLVAVVIAGV